MAELPDTKFKAYRIISVIYAVSMIEAIKNSEKAEMVEVTLQEEIEKPDQAKIGFNCK